MYRHTDGQWAYPLFHLESKCSAGIVIVLEAPNLEDTVDPDKRRLTCTPDTDPTGQFTFDLLKSVGLTPVDVLFTNAVLCLPAKRNGKHGVLMKQVGLCKPWLVKLIKALDPGVVVTLGGLALEAVGKIERHGLKLRDGVGKMHPWFGRRLLPLYHTSLLGRVNRPKSQQEEDFETLLEYLIEIGWPVPS